MLEEKTQFYLISVFSFVVFFTKLWQGPLTGDEACYALLSKEILKTGDWLIIHHPYFTEWSNFYEHPPLYMWITAINYKIFGISDFAAKLFSAFTGFASVIVLYFTAKKITDHHYAFLTASILATTLYFIDYGRKARLEVPLTFFILLSFFFVVLLLKEKRIIWAFLSGTAMSLAFLIKGIPAFASVLIAILAFIFITDGIKNKIVNTLIFLSGILFILLPWTLAQFYYDDGRFFSWYIFKQVGWSLAGRKSTGNMNDFNFASFLFYPKKLLLEIMVPWTFISLFGIWEIFKKKYSKDNIIKYIIVFSFLIILMAFSIVQFKKTRYILPVVPFLALLAAEFLYNQSWKNILIQWIARVLVFLTILIIFIATFTSIPFHSKKGGDFLKFKPQVESITFPGDSLLTGGIQPYDVYQVFSWYFDRPCKITDNIEGFSKAWQSGNYKLGIYKSGNESEQFEQLIGIERFDRNNNYYLFCK